MQAAENGTPLVDILMEQEEISENFSKEAILQAISPDKHVGMSRQLAQKTIAQVQAGLQGVEVPEPEQMVRCPLLSAEGTCQVRQETACSS